MQGTWKKIWLSAGLAVVICSAIAVVLILSGNDVTTTQSEADYPLLEPNEKLSDISSGWSRPPGPGGPLKFEFVGRFPKVPDRMLVYKVLRPQNVTEADVRELARNYFGMPADAQFRRNGRYCNLNTEAYNFMFQAHTGFFSLFKHKKARKKLSEDSKDYPSDEECKKIATEYLEERGLLPEDAYLCGVSGVNIGAVGAMSVWFGRKIGQYDIWGHGSDILVEIGVAGEITKVSKRWVEYEPYKMAPIKSPKEAFKQLKYGNALLMTSSGKATKIKLAYHTHSNDEYIQPVYSFGFGLPDSYAIVPAIKPEYLKSQEEMWKEYEEERSRGK
ncbi:MAG: hypothetical protein ACYS30_09640 [Planctomycetota bacterium]|jgi:hypothetical protein